MPEFQSVVKLLTPVSGRTALKEMPCLYMQMTTVPQNHFSIKEEKEKRELVEANGKDKRRKKIDQNGRRKTP